MYEFNDKTKRMMLVLLMAVILSGCCTKTSILLFNESDEPINVMSTQTMKSYQIAPNTDKCIPHTLGEILISKFGSKKQIRYSVDITTYEMDDASFFSGLPCINHKSVKAKFDENSGFEVLNTKRDK